MKTKSKRTFTVTLEIEASSEEEILRMGVGKLIDDRRTESFEIIDPETRHRQVRIRKGFMFNADQFILESKWSDEPDDEWGIEEIYEINEHDQINYHILGKIKEYKRVWGITVEIV